MAASTASFPISALSSSRSSSRTGKEWNLHSKQGRSVGNFGPFFRTVKKDVEVVRKGIDSGVGWASEALRVQQISESLDRLFWLRSFEDPTNSSPFRLPSWPFPRYPELSGVDLFLADVKAIEAYIGYFYHLSIVLKKPLPEVYDPQEVVEYFNLRPHVVGLRLIEVFASFASAAVRVQLSGTRNLGWSEDADKNISMYNLGVVLKETLLSLGPTFIKVGQSVSTRPDIIGFEITKVLSELHDQIPPFPRTLAMNIIQDELGAPVETFFSCISEEAVAAASFGQVYKARTIDGLDVAVKVQRPNLRHVVIRDIFILRLGLGLLKRIAKRKSDPRLYADELGKGLVGELDYTVEAANAAEFMEAHSPFPFIRVPKVLPHLSRKRVLTLEWITGENPNELQSISNEDSFDHGSIYLDRQQQARRHLLDLVDKGLQASLIQLFETGVMHADPHPGNLRYIMPGQIAFLDFGLICHMEKQHQFAMLASFVHIVTGDWPSLVGALVDMDVVRPGTNMRLVTSDLEDALGEVDVKDGIPDIKFSRVLGKIWTVALKYHFRMPPYYTLMLRSLASLEGLALAVDPNFKSFEASYPYVVRKLLIDNSAATRRILHSVLLNRKKELQWGKIAFFLRIGGTRKGLHLASKNESSLDYASKGPTSVSEAINLVLRLLVSKDGVVLRRLLMTADGASIVQAMVSVEAGSFRQQFCRLVADVLYQSMSRSSLGSKFIPGVTYSSAFEKIETGSTSGFSSPVLDYQSILGDRRLKVICLKVLESARKDRILMLRFSWVSFVIILKASALVCHRVLVSLSEAWLGRLPFSPKQLAMTT